jgi:PPOX class probable F420-dependent enzyme
MPLTIGPRLREFFDKRLLAIVATTTPRGAPELTPIWYEYADGQIWFNGQASRVWLQRMRQAGRATFFLMDDENAWKWAQVYGRVVDVADDVDSKQFARLGERYGRPLRGPVPNRVLVRVEITAVKGRSGTPSDSWDVQAA